MKLRISYGKKVERSEDEQIIFALCCLMFIPSINYFLNSVLQIGLSIHLSFLTPLAYIFMAGASGLVLYKYVVTRLSFVILLFMTIFATAISYLLYPEIRSSIYNSPVDLVYSSANKLVFFCIPALTGTACLRDHNGLFERMRNWGRLTVILGAFTFLFVFFLAGKKLNYMVYSYFMLLSICVCYEHAIITHTVLDLSIAILGSACIVMCGARGAVVSLALYFVVRVLARLRKRETRSNIMKAICAFVCILAVVILNKQFLQIGIALCDYLGINSRFLLMLSSGELMQDSARSYIAQAIVNGLAWNPLGYGLFSDRFVTGTYGYSRYVYSHNIFLELLCDFGIVGGSILIVALLWRLAKTIRALEKRPERSLLYVLLPYGFFQLLFSSSFLENTLFFMILAMIFCVNWGNESDMQNGDLA